MLCPINNSHNEGSLRFVKVFGKSESIRTAYCLSLLMEGASIAKPTSALITSPTIEPTCNSAESDFPSNRLPSTIFWVVVGLLLVGLHLALAWLSSSFDYETPVRRKAHIEPSAHRGYRRGGFHDRYLGYPIISTREPRSDDMGHRGGGPAPRHYDDFHTHAGDRLLSVYVGWRGSWPMVSAHTVIRRRRPPSLQTPFQLRFRNWPMNPAT